MLLSRSRLCPLVALAIALVACGGGGGPSGPVTYRTGVNPVGLAVRGSVLWVAEAGEGAVAKIDLASHRVLDRVHIGDFPAYSQACLGRSIHQVPHGTFEIRKCDVPKGMALGDGGLWVTGNDTQTLFRIDPGSDRVVARIPIGVGAWYVAAGPSGVWATDYDTSTVVRVDPRSNEVTATITNVPIGPTGIAVTRDAVWVACSRANVVARIDPATNQVVATIPVGVTPVPVAMGFGSVWVRNENQEHAATVSRIDPTSNRVVATVPIGLDMGRDGLDGLAAGSRHVWVPGLELQKIDPSANRVVGQVDRETNAAIASGGGIWTIDLAYSVTRFDDA